MKKKRSEIKTSESSSNAKNDKASPPLDRHHNQSAPCSNLAAAIAQEIFPTMVTSLSSKAAAAAAGAGADVGHPAENEERLGRNCSSTSTVVASASGKKVKSEKQKTKNGASLTQEQQQPTSLPSQQQPLLGYMIQQFLLEDRIKARKVETANSVLKNNGNNNTISATSIKKRKSKKKKKKICSLISENGDDNECQQSSAVVAVEEEEKEAVALKTTSTSQPSAISQQSSSNMFVESLSGEGGIHDLSQSTMPFNLASLNNVDSTSNSRPSSPWMNSSARNNGKHTDTFTTAKNGRSSGLDRLLDSLIDSKHSSSILDADALNHSRGGGRNIESFSAYLRRKFVSHLGQSTHLQQTQQQKKDKSKGGGVSTTAATAMKNYMLCGGVELKDILPTISFKDVNDLVEKSIDCRKCRTSVSTRLRSLATLSQDDYCFFPEGVEIELGTPPSTLTMTKHPPRIILNERSANIVHSPSSPFAEAKGGHGLSIPVSGAFSDGIDSAFSYFNMDEVDLETGEGGVIVGGGIDNAMDDSIAASSPQSSLFHLELRPIPQANAAGYLQIGTLSGTEEVDQNGTLVQEYPMNTSDIIDLVKFILLPCGLSENALGEDNDPSIRYDLSGEELSAIVNEAISFMNPIQSKIFGANQAMREIEEIMEEAEDSNTRSCLYSTTSRLLNDADMKIEIVLKQLGDVMFQLFKTTCFVGWSSNLGPKLLLSAQRLWERYNAALVSLIEPTLRHRGSLLQPGVRGRKVPQAYYDAVVRDSLHELVQAKFTALSLLLLEFSVILNGEKGSCPLAEVFVLRAFRQYVERPKVLSVDKVFPDQESEALLQQLIAARIHFSQTTINSVFCDGIINMAKKQRDTMDGLCTTMRKIVIAMEDFAPETKLEFLRKGYESNEFSYYDLVKSRNSLCETDTGFEARNAALLLKISANLITQWLILLCSRQCHESSMESLELPSRLQKWLANTSGTKFHTSIPDDKKPVEECDGSGGERRISSILAGLLYRWLEARCSEWHAELTRDELLQSMDMEETIIVNEESGKVGKKKKSKRKSGGDDKKKEKAEKNEAGDGLSTSFVEKKRVELDVSSSCARKVYPVEGSTDVEWGITMSIGEECGVDEFIKQQESTGEQQSSPLEDITIEKVSSTETCNASYANYPGVGVVDGQQFVAAEIYLVNRLKVILGKSLA